MISPEREKRDSWGDAQTAEGSQVFAPHALKGQKLLAQGSALGYHVRKLVALTGRLADCYYTQGAALG